MQPASTWPSAAPTQRQHIKDTPLEALKKAVAGHWAGKSRAGHQQAAKVVPPAAQCSEEMATASGRAAASWAVTYLPQPSCTGNRALQDGHAGARQWQLLAPDTSAAGRHDTVPPFNIQRCSAAVGSRRAACTHAPAAEAEAQPAGEAAAGAAAVASAKAGSEAMAETVAEAEVLAVAAAATAAGAWAEARAQAVAEVEASPPTTLPLSPPPSGWGLSWGSPGATYVTLAPACQTWGPAWGSPVPPPPLIVIGPAPWWPPLPLSTPPPLALSAAPPLPLSPPPSLTYDGQRSRAGPLQVDAAASNVAAAQQQMSSTAQAAETFSRRRVLRAVRSTSTAFAVRAAGGSKQAGVFEAQPAPQTEVHSSASALQGDGSDAAAAPVEPGPSAQAAAPCTAAAHGSAPLAPLQQEPAEASCSRRLFHAARSRSTAEPSLQLPAEATSASDTKPAGACEAQPGPEAAVHSSASALVSGKPQAVEPVLSAQAGAPCRAPPVPVQQATDISSGRRLLCAIRSVSNAAAVRMRGSSNQAGVSGGDVGQKAGVDSSAPAPVSGEPQAVLAVPVEAGPSAQAAASAAPRVPEQLTLETSSGTGRRSLHAMRLRSASTAVEVRMRADSKQAGLGGAQRRQQAGMDSSACSLGGGQPQAVAATVGSGPSAQAAAPDTASRPEEGKSSRRILHAVRSPAKAAAGAPTGIKQAGSCGVRKQQQTGVCSVSFMKENRPPAELPEVCSLYKSGSSAQAGAAGADSMPKQHKSGIRVLQVARGLMEKGALRAADDGQQAAEGYAAQKEQQQADVYTSAAAVGFDRPQAAASSRPGERNRGNRVLQAARAILENAAVHAAADALQPGACAAQKNQQAGGHISAPSQGGNEPQAVAALEPPARAAEPPAGSTPVYHSSSVGRSTGSRNRSVYEADTYADQLWQPQVQEKRRKLWCPWNRFQPSTRSHREE